jgi:putative addiction module component (TIGR02574 family)
MLNREIQEEALKLGDLEKIRLIELLMDDLERPNPDVEKLWIQESEERYKAFKEGKVKGIPFELIEKRYSK